MFSFLKPTAPKEKNGMADQEEKLKERIEVHTEAVELIPVHPNSPILKTRRELRKERQLASDGDKG